MQEEKEVMIEQIEASIEKTKTNLKAQQMLLKELTKEPPRPFATTYVGRKLNGFLSVMTKPFADIHHVAHTAATDPHSYVVCKVLAKADKVLEQAQAVPNRDHKDARKMTIKAARLKLELSRWEKEDLFLKRVTDLENSLQAEVARLRPEQPSEQAVNDAKQLFSELETNDEGPGSESEPTLSPV